MSSCSSPSSSAWPRQRPHNTVLTVLYISLATLSFFAGISDAVSTPIRLPASLGYQGRSNACPARCAKSGPNPGNWSMYHNFAQFDSCQESLFYSFSFIDPVDNPDPFHHIYACTSFGPDWGNLPANASGQISASAALNSTNGTYQIATWPSAPGSAVASTLATLIHQFRQYLSNGFGPVNRPTVLFAGYGSTSVGLYIGAGLQNQGIGDVALAYLEQTIATSNASHAAQVAMQFCEPGQNSDHIFGLMATGNGTFAAIQEALTAWSMAECLSYPLLVQNFTATVPLLTPLYNSKLTNATNTTMTSNSTNSTLNLNSTSTSGNASTNSTLNSTSTSTSGNAISNRRRALEPRTTCSTIQVVSGDSCASLAQRCGITPAQFTADNPSPTECSTLQPGEHVCCSPGTLPNFAPSPQPDGVCATYTVQPGDYCALIASTYSLTLAELESYNTNTWSWSGCSLLFADAIICLSTGRPPMPAVVANAVCGPQVPGTVTPPAGTNLSTLNPCPLNACCDIWGQCGTTSDFCTPSGTGAPGTAAPGTNGCISNCGIDIVLSAPPAVYRRIGFYEGYNLDRPCLYQDISQLDVTAYTHIYFSFGVLDTSYAVQLTDESSEYEFGLFTQIQGAARILSIGGWTFSTAPSTYMIFRNGVTAANRLTMATNIANFVIDNNLDGVNIDWEYPGAPDIPGIPPASTADGANYLDFLAILRNFLPDKEITIAAPASYWYLKGFPIEAMAPLVDYIIYMTYDLHGQWDSGNQWSQIGCSTGTCLRTDVNLTETIGTLVMITKAGVPSNKVVVGVTSYGRSFAMAEAGCYGPQCTFLGSADSSQATPGVCTQTAGYIANAEILGIIADPSRVNENFVDASSNTNILVYDNTQWVGWMSDEVKAERTELYELLSMGGWSDWATDLQTYNSPPYSASSWQIVIHDVSTGADPYSLGPRTGNWTTLNCDNPAVQNQDAESCPERWAELDAANAWSDVINIWFTNGTSLYKGGNAFTLCVFNTFHLPEGASCGSLAPLGSCSQSEACADFAGFGVGTGGSGPAAMVIYNSFTVLNLIYTQYYNAINNAAGSYIDSQLQDFELTFAPVPPPKSDEWILILIAFLSLGLTAVAAPFFAGVFAEIPALVALGEAGTDVVADITYATIAFGAAVATATIPAPESPGSWTAATQANFSATMGTIITGWATVAENQLWALFDGSEASVSLLGTLIANGNLIECDYGSPEIDYNPSDNTKKNVEGFIARAFFGFAIPEVWLAAGTPAFILDSGYSCTGSDSMSPYLDSQTQTDTSTCYNGNLYYLVYPNGGWSACAQEEDDECVASTFSAPPGLSSLGGGNWGGITRDDIAIGSVRTYVANGNSNTGAFANPLDQATLQDLQNQDITTPGYIRLPVCTAQVAWTSWSTPSQSNSSASGYPCNPLQGITKCSGYTYVDETSSASPLVSDCQTIVKNIQGTSGEWTTGISSQRDIASFGTCHFGVQNSGVTGDVTFFTGSQDIVNIITESIALYAANGATRVGSKGFMECGGDAGSQKVLWGLY